MNIFYNIFFFIKKRYIINMYLLFFLFGLIEVNMEEEEFGVEEIEDVGEVEDE